MYILHVYTDRIYNEISQFYKKIKKIQIKDTSPTRDGARN